MRQDVQLEELWTQEKVSSVDKAQHFQSFDSTQDLRPFDKAYQDLRHPEEDSLQEFTLYLINQGITACIRTVMSPFSEAAKTLRKTERPHLIFRAFWEVLRYKV